MRAAWGIRRLQQSQKRHGPSSSSSRALWSAVVATVSPHTLLLSSIHDTMTTTTSTRHPQRFGRAASSSSTTTNSKNNMSRPKNWKSQTVSLRPSTGAAAPAAPSSSSIGSTSTSKTKPRTTPFLVQKRVQNHSDDLAHGASLVPHRTQQTIHVEPSGSRAQVLAQIDALVSEINNPRFELTMEFLKQVVTVLKTCNSHVQCLAAVPLCDFVSQHVHSVQVVSAVTEAVRVYDKLNNHELVLELVDKMLAKDMFLQSPVLVRAINAATALQSPERGFLIFEQALQKGTTPNMAVYMALVSAMGAYGDTTGVKGVLAKMKQSGFAMNNVVYHTIMAAYAKGGKPEEALALFDEMKEANIPLDEHSFAILMDVYAEKQDFDRAFELMDELLASDSLQPTLVNYNVMLKVCGKSSRLAKAFQLYEQMKKKGILPDRITFTTMMHAVYHGEITPVDPRLAQGVLAGAGLVTLASLPMIDFDKHWLTVLFCSSVVGSIGLATYMHPDGVRRSLYPNSDEPHNEPLFQAFFRRMKEEDHCGRTMYLWREMVKMAQPPDAHIYDVLLRTCVKKRYPGMAYEAIFRSNLPATFAETGEFVLSLPSTAMFLHSLLVQNQIPKAQHVFEEAFKAHLFDEVLSVENLPSQSPSPVQKNVHRKKPGAGAIGPQQEQESDKYLWKWNLSGLTSTRVNSFLIANLVKQTKDIYEQRFRDAAAVIGDVDKTVDRDPMNKCEFPCELVFEVVNGYDVLDQLDVEDANVRNLFAMDEIREVRGSAAPINSMQHHHRQQLPRSTNTTHLLFVKEFQLKDYLG